MQGIAADCNMLSLVPQHYVTTLLWICGENLDVELVNQRLSSPDPSLIHKASILRKGEWNGVQDDRSFDSRVYQDRWCQGLSTNQAKWTVEKQLEFWIKRLYPVRSAFQEFKRLGYWSVIDCQLAARNLELPSIQFRLTQKIQLELSELGVDLDFTIYRPVD